MPAFNPIVTPRLTLRPPRLTDADSIYEEYATDPEVTRYLIWSPHTSIEDTRAFLATRFVERGERPEESLVITLTGVDRAIGMIGYRHNGHKADIGYVLGRKHWGRGIMTEAGRAVVERLFAIPGVRRVWATCDVDNIGSARVLEKIGMTREGILRRWIVHPAISADPRDSLVYAVVR
jgi:RimJ/RimL family protein N-acetyltransferase